MLRILLIMLGSIGISSTVGVLVALATGVDILAPAIAAFLGFVITVTIATLDI